ncbi:MAG: queuosine precursor transporter [Bacilli bacterium]|nr:queuosine precursor transporter [Bacilli bacterium]
MIDIYLICIELLICMTIIPIIYKKYQTEGLYIYSIVAFILSNVMSLKIISLSSFELNLGIVLFTSSFIASNIIIQKKGYEEIKKLVLFIVVSSIVSFGCLYLTSLIDSSNINNFTNRSFDNIFDGSARIYFANIVTMLYFLILNGKLYYYLKKEKNKVWISNLFSGIIIQFLASCSFLIIAYAIIKEPIDIIKLIIIRYLVSLITVIIGTIPIYISSKFKID